MLRSTIELDPQRSQHLSRALWSSCLVSSHGHIVLPVAMMPGPGNYARLGFMSGAATPAQKVQG